MLHHQNKSCKNALQTSKSPSSLERVFRHYPSWGCMLSICLAKSKCCEASFVITNENRIPGSFFIAGNVGHPSSWSSRPEGGRRAPLNGAPDSPASNFDWAPNYQVAVPWAADKCLYSQTSVRLAWKIVFNFVRSTLFGVETAPRLELLSLLHALSKLLLLPGEFKAWFPLSLGLGWAVCTGSQLGGG